MGRSGGRLMAALALADLLTDFGSRTHRVEQRAPAPAPRPEPVLEPPYAAPVPDVSARIAAEVAKAEEAVTERLSALYEATLQAERDNHAAERDELRRSLGVEAAALIGSRLAAMEEQLVSLTTTTAARVLGGLLTEAIQKRAVAVLADKVRNALRESDAVRIRVTGPQSLYDALAASLGEHSHGIDFVESPSFDLAVDIDSSIYETRLAEWSAELAGVLS
jgi:hypothetical protein